MGKEAMGHWNGHLLCAVTMLPTGGNIDKHDLIQFVIAPVDYNLRQSISPFIGNIKPYKGRREDWEIPMNKADRIISQASDIDNVVTALEFWYDKHCGKTKFGTKRKLLPLAYNWANKSRWLRDAIGDYFFEEFFSDSYRDIMCTALSYNDRLGWKLEKPAFSKTTFTYLNSLAKTHRDYKFDCCQEALCLIEIYKQMMSTYLGV